MMRFRTGGNIRSRTAITAQNNGVSTTATLSKPQVSRLINALKENRDLSDNYDDGSSIVLATQPSGVAIKLINDGKTVEVFCEKGEVTAFITEINR